MLFHLCYVWWCLRGHFYNSMDRFGQEQYTWNRRNQGTTKKGGGLVSKQVCSSATEIPANKHF